jgi:hypothetical protein
MENLITAQLPEALAAAQAEMTNPPLDGFNPHFKSKFSSLPMVRNHVVPPLNKRGIACIQTFVLLEGRQCFLTRLIKGSDAIDSILLVPEFDSAQKLAAWTTYARRIMLAAIGGVAGEQDMDGEGLEHAPQPPVQAPVPKIVPTLPTEPPVADRGSSADQEGLIIDAVGELTEAAVEGRKEGIKQIWNEVKADHYVATRVWTELKTNFPDEFKIIKPILKPEGDKTPRGPKPAETVTATVDGETVTGIEAIRAKIKANGPKV